MADIKKTIKGAAHQVAETAKEVGHKLADVSTQAADWVKGKTGLGHGVGTADVKPGQAVIGVCGTRLGSVEAVEGGAIKLSHRDSPDALPHFIPAGWVARVDDRVHLFQTAAVAKKEWHPTAAACATPGA